jgi:predicted nucleic acid-binding protein
MMSSLDTNILIYAADQDASEHPAAHAIVAEMLAQPDDWILADQVLFEFYKALRNPRVFLDPLNAPEAAHHVRFLQSESGVTRCCYGLEHWDRVFSHLQNPATPAGRTRDLVLGITLKAHGVGRFFTRNTKDFQSIGFAELLNPIDI